MTEVPGSGPSQPRPGGRRPDRRPPEFDEGPFDVVGAFKWALDLLRSDVGVVALPVIAVDTLSAFVALVVPRLVGSLLRSALKDPDPPVATVVQHSLALALAIVVTAYASACLYPYLLKVARGNSVTLAEAFRPSPHWGNALKLSAMLVLGTSVAALFCLVPGLIAVAISVTAMPRLLDGNLEPIDALARSVADAKAYPMQMAVFAILGTLLILAGTALCLVGALLVSIPVVILAQIYIYLRLHGETPLGAA